MNRRNFIKNTLIAAAVAAGGSILGKTAKSALLRENKKMKILEVRAQTAIPTPWPTTSLKAPKPPAIKSFASMPLSNRFTPALPVIPAA